MMDCNERLEEEEHFSNFGKIGNFLVLLSE